MTEKAGSRDASAELDRHFDWIAERLPPKGANFVRWVRQPSSRWVRIPLALLLIVGGVLSFLPVLGIWMLPLGLLLVAQDVPFLQQPLADALGWGERKWMEWKAKREAKDETRTTKDDQ
ncbi:MAG: hypothetical protein BGN84_05350 [Afipia sp. 62-7]|nr:hypothetical protein [Afipia sp.]OJU21165.1 MAG: hypothetical protein BGN84_05350 [Afipia sp. 62-7]